MSKGHQKDVWIHTANLICAIFNANRSANSDPLTFRDAYPFLTPIKEEPIDDIELAKAAWLAGG